MAAQECCLANSTMGRLPAQAPKLGAREGESQPGGADQGGTLKWFPGQPRSAAPGPAPPLRPSAAREPEPAAPSENKRSCLSAHLAARGACHQCHCTAPGHAEVPSSRNRDRGLETRPTGPLLLLCPMSSPFPSLLVPRLFSSPNLLFLWLQIKKAVWSLGASRARKGTKDRQTINKASQVRGCRSLA